MYGGWVVEWGGFPDTVKKPLTPDSIATFSRTRTPTFHHSDLPRLVRQTQWHSKAQHPPTAPAVSLP
ncbi:hypothetical protein N431DRAFT_439143 [Stipitochalara longipes BDJ]|nr:hypothetical protein N431DRAFT_439143 [Stipitochalara longipes BDJ]